MLRRRRPWQEELAIIDRTMKAISGIADPEELVSVYWQGIGELIAIENCYKFAAAEKHYKEEPEDPTNSSPTSLVGKAASGSSGGDPVLLDGYYFRLARGQAGKGSAAIALIAYPEEYRSSGVMTFVVLQSGVVYEKDLGANTSAVATGMTSFHKDASWRIAGE